MPLLPLLSTSSPLPPICLRLSRIIHMKTIVNNISLLLSAEEMNLTVRDFDDSRCRYWESAVVFCLQKISRTYDKCLRQCSCFFGLLSIYFKRNFKRRKWVVDGSEPRDKIIKLRDIVKQLVSRALMGISAIVDEERWCCCSSVSVPISLPGLLTLLLRDLAL